VKLCGQNSNARGSKKLQCMKTPSNIRRHEKVIFYLSLSGVPVNGLWPLLCLMLPEFKRDPDQHRPGPLISLKCTLGRGIQGCITMEQKEPSRKVPSDDRLWEISTGLAGLESTKLT
jgi:hypothetical protein